MTSGLFWGRTHLGMALSCSLGAERWAGWMVGVCPWFWVFGGEGEADGARTDTLQHNVSPQG